MAAPTNIPLSVFDVPFSRSVQLCDSLAIQDPNGEPHLASTIASQNWLPGYPAVPLAGPEIVDCLRRELPTPLLDKMFPYLWLVATQASAHVAPLHEQLVRGRHVVITENPELHLVWVHDRVFLKPIPPWLLSHDFWQAYLCGSKTSPPSFQSLSDVAELRRAALGYLRTYRHLVRHESDFRIAERENLVPPGIEWPQFVAFTSAFGRVRDDDVTLRYRYGQLRLTRLNLWAKVALRRWTFHKFTWQYADIFSRFYAPILFIIGILSVVLSAMQVGVQARPDWEAFTGVASWFSVLALLCVLAIVVFIIGFLLLMVTRELIFAMKAKYKKK